MNFEVFFADAGHSPTVTIRRNCYGRASQLQVIQSLSSTISIHLMITRPVNHTCVPVPDSGIANTVFHLKTTFPCRNATFSKTLRTYPYPCKIVIDLIENRLHYERNHTSAHRRQWNPIIRRLAFIRKFQKTEV